MMPAIVQSFSHFNRTGSSLRAWIFLCFGWFCSNVMPCAASQQNPCVVVRGAADYSLMLSLVRNTPLEVRMMPKHKGGCVCCQHGAPHAHMTVSEARNKAQSCIMPRLKNWADIQQALRMINRWVVTLVRYFPEHKDTFVSNKESLIKTLTQLQEKWQDSDKKKANNEEADVSPTIGGYVQALEKWHTSQEATPHADRSVRSSSAAGN